MFSFVFVFKALEVPQRRTDQDREQDSSLGLKTLNMNISTILE